MARMQLHFLDARGGLDGLHDWLGARLQAGFARADALLPLGDVDVVVKASGFVIPEKGHGGYAPEPGVVYVSLDPDNPALRVNENNSPERMIAHELHHAARWDGPGYGASLGAALVSEGLAGHFARAAYGGPPEPWEALPEAEWRPCLARAAALWDSRDYDHAEWFFGSGALPRWLGYSIGYRAVDRYLSAHPGDSAASLAHSDHPAFRPFLDELTP